MEKKLMEQLGMNVAITHREGEAGEVVVRYKICDQLECRRLQGDYSAAMPGQGRCSRRLALVRAI